MQENLLRDSFCASSWTRIIELPLRVRVRVRVRVIRVRVRVRVRDKEVDVRRTFFKAKEIH